jgi:tellurite resistance protein
VVRAVKGKPTEADWILRAMIAVAGADGRLDAREVRLIQDVYHDQTGRSVEVSGVVLAVEAYFAQRDLLTELSIAAGSMPQETKEKIIRAAYLTLLADKRVAGEERKRLDEIAAALQISEVDLDDLVTKIESTSIALPPTSASSVSNLG